MVDKRYPNAFKEVNEVLLHTDIDLTNKIPLKFRKFLEENMNKEYDFCIKENLSLEQQGISKEAENILALIYRNYWATPIEKEEFIKTGKIYLSVLGNIQPPVALYIDRPYIRQ